MKGICCFGRLQKPSPHPSPEGRGVFSTAVLAGCISQAGSSCLSPRERGGVRVFVWPVKISRLLLTLWLVAFLCLLSHNAYAMPHIQTITSPEGRTAWLIEDHAVPLVAVNFLFRDAGSATDPEALQGLATLSASLLTEGAGDLDSDAFHTLIEEKAIRLGYSASRDTFSGYLQTLTEHLDTAAQLVNSTLTQPRLDVPSLARAREQQKTSISYREQTPDAQVEKLWWEAAFAGHPYRLPPDGTPAALDTITRTDVAGFLDSRLADSNLVVSIAGDITAERASALLDAMFQGLPATAEAMASIPSHTLSGPLLKVAKRDLPQSVAVFGQPGIDRRDPDYYAALLVNYVLGGGGFASRLMEEVREKRGLTYGIGTGLVALHTAPLLMGRVSTVNGSMAEALRLTREVFADMQTKGLTAAELQNAKDYVNGSFPLELDSTRKLASLLTSMQYFGLPQDFLEQREGLINAVTLADANRVAQRLLAPDRLVIYVIGNPDLAEIVTP
jgi:zinc protease